MPVESTVESRELTDLSPNRIRVADKCGLAFKYQYVDRLPTPSESASAIFGNAIHDGLYHWYGGGPITADNKDQHQDLSLVDTVRDQWAELLPPKVWEYVLTLIDLDQERQAVAEAVKIRRPGLKNPQATKEFLTSQASLDFVAKQIEMREMCDGMSEVRWPRDEDAFQAYQRAEQIARRLERQWKPLPRPLAVEEPFRLEFEGFVIRGRIDQVRQDLDPKTGELHPPEVIDVKTGRQLMTQMEAFSQSFLYNEANRQIEWLPDTDIMKFWMVRHHTDQGNTKVQEAHIDRERHGKLALRILNGVGRRIITGQFEPHYGHWCKSCDFADLCEAEISLWKGDGLMIEGVPE